MSVNMFRPAASASEPTILAPCQSNGRTNERHRPTRILPIPWPRWRKVGLLYIWPIPLSPWPRPTWCGEYRTNGSIIRYERRRRLWRVFIQLLENMSKVKNDFRKRIAIWEGNRVPYTVSYQYRNVSEWSLFHRYVVQVFKDFVTEGCGLYEFIAESRWLNKCP